MRRGGGRSGNYIRYGHTGLGRPITLANRRRRVPGRARKSRLFVFVSVKLRLGQGRPLPLLTGNGGFFRKMSTKSFCIFPCDNRTETNVFGSVQTFKAVPHSTNVTRDKTRFSRYGLFSLKNRLTRPTVFTISAHSEVVFRVRLFPLESLAHVRTPFRPRIRFGK